MPDGDPAGFRAFGVAGLDALSVFAAALRSAGDLVVFRVSAVSIFITVAGVAALAGAFATALGAAAFFAGAALAASGLAPAFVGAALAVGTADQP